MSSTPTPMRSQLAEGRLPVADFEELDDTDTARRGRDAAGAAARRAAGGGARRGRTGRAETLRGDGLLLRGDDVLVLTDRGRLLADAVVRDLLE